MAAVAHRSWQRESHRWSPARARPRRRGERNASQRDATIHEAVTTISSHLALALHRFGKLTTCTGALIGVPGPPRRTGGKGKGKGRASSDGGSAQGEAGGVPGGHGGAMEVGSGGAHPSPNLLPLLPMDALAVSHPFVDARRAEQRRFALGGSPQGAGTRARAPRQHSRSDLHSSPAMVRGSLAQFRAQARVAVRGRLVALVLDRMDRHRTQGGEM